MPRSLSSAVTVTLNRCKPSVVNQGRQFDPDAAVSTASGIYLKRYFLTICIIVFRLPYTLTVCGWFQLSAVKVKRQI